MIYVSVLELEKGTRPVSRRRQRCMVDDYSLVKEEVCSNCLESAMTHN